MSVLSWDGRPLHEQGDRKSSIPSSVDQTMSKNGTNHTDGKCDNCGARGKLGWIIGRPDKKHFHACTKEDCKDALEAKKSG
jgi:hypothetical protein